MARAGEITIDENSCFGCRYCELFCPKNCIKVSMSKINALGYPMAVVTDPEKCTGCGNCAIMCPQYSIEVYLLDQENTNEKVA